jgi:hypothetical protein
MVADAALERMLNPQSERFEVMMNLERSPLIGKVR